MVIKRIDPMSCAKVSGLLYAGIGLLLGACFTLFMTAIESFVPQDEPQITGLLGMVFGAGAIVMMPIFYGALGFIGGFIAAFIYNVVAGWTGGIQIEVQ